MMLVGRRVGGRKGFLLLLLLEIFVLFFKAEVRIKSSILYLYKLSYLKEIQWEVCKMVSQAILDIRSEVKDGYIKLKVMGI